MGLVCLNLRLGGLYLRLVGLDLRTFIFEFILDWGFLVFLYILWS